MTLIQVSNILLDKPFPYFRKSEFGRRRRERLKNIFADILDVAIRRKVDAILIPGNLFCEKWVSDDTLKYVAKLFESLDNIEVFIAPGDMDCICEESIYLCELFPKNVHIFVEPGWEIISCDGVPLCVMGFGKQKSDMCASTPPIEHLSRDTNNVCLAYELEFPIEEVFAKTDVPLSYIALGNSFSEEKRELPNGVVVCRSGAPEKFDFSQEGVSGFYFVSFTFEKGKWKVSQVERVSIQGTTYQEVVIECSNYTESEDVLHEIALKVKAIPTPKVVKIKLVGNLSLGMFHEILKSIDEAMKECDDYFFLPDVEFIETSDESFNNSPFLLSEFLRVAMEDINSVPTERLREVVRRAIYLVLSARENKHPEFIWKIED